MTIVQHNRSGSETLLRDDNDILHIQRVGEVMTNVIPYNHAVRLNEETDSFEDIGRVFHSILS